MQNAKSVWLSLKQDSSLTAHLLARLIFVFWVGDGLLDYT